MPGGGDEEEERGVGCIAHRKVHFQTAASQRANIRPPLVGSRLESGGKAEQGTSCGSWKLCSRFYFWQELGVFFSSSCFCFTLKFSPIAVAFTPDSPDSERHSAYVGSPNHLLGAESPTQELFTPCT